MTSKCPLCGGQMVDRTPKEWRGLSPVISCINAPPEDIDQLWDTLLAATVKKYKKQLIGKVSLCGGVEK